MRRLFSRPPKDATALRERDLERDAARGRALLEESPRLVAVLDDEGRVVAASRRTKETIGEIRVGERLPAALTEPNGTRAASYDVAGGRETVVYLPEPVDPSPYEELRIGFTAAVSHELRTPLARLLALLETTELPGADPVPLIEEARAQVIEMRELVDDILFLSELDTGRAVVALGATPAVPVVKEVFEDLSERATNAGVSLRVEGDTATQLPLRRRILAVIVENLAINAIRYAGPGATFTVTVRDGELVARDDGAGVPEVDVPRLFERFYRSDRARASRGTGLGLAIVKHVVTSAGGRVEASGGPGRGLTITSRFPEA
ncbi:MAG: HAMP domain-containing histidine kinase [Thermoleophilia bacterium]|nr:HAMP domain-containing histidine kinase [Thermoleophilia bacterium]